MRWRKNLIMSICKGCGIEREFLENGVCIVCRRGDKHGTEVKRVINRNIRGNEITSNHKDNEWMNRNI